MSDEKGAADAAPRFFPLSVQRHGSLRIARERGYGFARSLNAVPLVLPELAAVVATYPAVFMPGDAPLLAAVLGVDEKQNLFVDEFGQWAPGAYIPAAVRQQPFSLARSGNGGEFVVAIDEGHQLLSETEGDPIFEGTALSKRTEEIVALCREMQAAVAATEEFVRAVRAAGLLDAKAAPFLRPDGTHGFVQGLSMIDAARLRELPEATIIEWHRRGWLGASYLHLASERRWPSLFERAGLRSAPADGR